tara:strand:+ start:507 stop:1538 length:1032 start_codon:yes stop_codon:yes gene_type:complete
MQSKLFIISNESIFHSNNSFFCDNLDMKSTPEGLKKNFDINLFARSSKKQRSHLINIEKIKTYTNILTFLFSIFKTFNEKNSKYLIVSISPYTFITCILLSIFRKKPIIFLRSDGYKEYRSKLGFIGSIIFHCMFFVVSKISYFISCGEQALRGQKGLVIFPSQLSDKWFLNKKDVDLRNIKLLYVGRIRIEKGVFFLLKIMKEINEDITLSVVGMEKFSEINNKNKQKNINIYQIETSEEKLIKYYDEHNIFVLPSYTEGYPMVVLESLARLRPVIIFEEIKHIIGDKKGIFISERNSKSFLEKINYIKNNYHQIQEDMKKNSLPSKKDYLKKFSDYISKEF